MKTYTERKAKACAKRSTRRARFGLTLLAFCLLTACANTQPQSNAESATERSPKNVILMVGDGMGFAYLKAYRLFKDQADTPAIDQTLFDQLLTGAVATDSNQAVGLVTDSAAAATTYATGFKTKNGAIGVDNNDQALKTVVEYASENGRRSGLVSTSHVNHATPAAFIAHVPSRSQYPEIADYFYDNQYQGKPRVDVILGGGSSYFQRDDRDLVAEFQTAGYQFLKNKEDLLAAKGDKLIGLFAPKGLPPAWDREDSTPSLADMTDLALSTLNRDTKGFFLLVEGSQIDWGGHNNDILYALSEMEDFERAIAKVLAFMEENPDTLLIVTADHETGGLSIGANGNYGWDVDLLRSIHATPLSLALKVSAAEDPLKTFTQLTSIEPNDSEAQQLLVSLKDQKKLHGTIKKIVDRASFTGWTSKGHTGIDVPLMAKGPGSEDLKGLIDNTKIGQRLIELNQR